METAIRTHFEFPPIPVRDFDWCATRDGWEPGDPVGHGRTPFIAMQNLLDAEEDC